MKKLLIITTLILSACASKEKVKEISTEIQEQGTVSGGIIGLDNDGVAIIQKEQTADQELRSIIWSNNQKEMELESEAHRLERCRVDIADPRLGGSGDVVEIPEIDSMKPASDLKKELGLVKGKLMVVSKESFKQRLEAENSYESNLDKMIKQISRHRKSCEIKMGQQRRKAGLPSSRYQGMVSVTPDGKVNSVTAPHEHSLDDAFKIREMEKPNSTTPLDQE